MNIVAVVGLRWITRSARAGESSVTLWILAWLVFFLPLAAAVIELSSRHPEQGGLYAWTRRAFGPVHGFICGWCLWVNNLFYFPSLLLFAAANLLLLFGPAAVGADRQPLLRGDVRARRAVGLRRPEPARARRRAAAAVGGQRQHVGAGGAADRGRRGRLCHRRLGVDFSASTLLPRTDVLGTLGLWSAMCFAFSGFEIGAPDQRGSEGCAAHDPARDPDLRRRRHRHLHRRLGLGADRRASRRAEGAERHRRRRGPRGRAAGSGRDGRDHRWVGRVGSHGRQQLVVRRRGAHSVCRRRARGPAAGVRPPAPAPSHAGHRHRRAGRRRRRAIFLAQRLCVGHRRQHDDPGGLRHPGEPHHPGVLRAVPVSVSDVDSSAEDRRPQRSTGRRGRAWRDCWPVAGGDGGISGDGDFHRAGLRAAARHRQRAQLRSEPDRPVGRRDRGGRRHCTGGRPVG